MNNEDKDLEQRTLNSDSNGDGSIDSFMNLSGDTIDESIVSENVVPEVEKANLAGVDSLPSIDESLEKFLEDTATGLPFIELESNSISQVDEVLMEEASSEEGAVESLETSDVVVSSFESRKDNKAVVIILVSIIFLSIVGIVYFIIFGVPTGKVDTEPDQNEVPNNNETENPSNEVVDADKFGSKTEFKNLYIYRAEGFGVHLSPDEKIDDPLYDYYTYVGEYKCSTDKCYHYYVANGNFVVIYDNGYYIYDFVKNEKIDINDKVAEFGKFGLIAYQNILYGYTVTKDNKVGLYSLEKNEIVIDYKYDYISNDELNVNTKGKVFVSDYSKNTISIYDVDKSKTLLNIDGNKFGDYSSVEYIVIYTRENNGNLIYVADYGAIGSTVFIYNDKFEQILGSKPMGSYIITDDGYIYATNDVDQYIDVNKTIVKYDFTGKEISRSEIYKEIKLVLNSYFVAVDNDDNLVLIDYSDKVVATFTKWTDEMLFHGMLSGYWEPGDGKPNGVYVVIEDKSIPEGTMGRGKEYYYAVATGETGVFELTEIGGYAKPVLYLYPLSTTEVSVRFSKPELLTTTYPKFYKQWNVTAYSNGDLFDKNNKYYYGLYWEEEGSTNVDFKEGFYVTKDNAITFLEEKLTKIGLSDRERNEFIMYWLPILEKNGQSLVYFELTESRENYNKLLINPRPDSLLRLAIHIKKVDSKANIKEQTLPTFERKGFVAIEWGGVIH